MILKLSYILLQIIINLILFLFAKYTIDRTFPLEKRTRKKALVLLGLTGWNVYLFWIGTSGFLTNLTAFPPRFVYALIVPCFLFTAVFLIRNRNKAWLLHIPTHWLVYFHSFRILVETLFVFTVSAGFLHKEVTIEGYNFDMIFGITAIPMGWWVYRMKAKSHILLKIWNYLGVLVLVSVIFLFLASNYAYEIFGYSSSPVKPEFGLFPYMLVPGFLMPAAIFVHFLSLLQLRKKEK